MARKSGTRFSDKIMHREGIIRTSGDRFLDTMMLQQNATRRRFSGAITLFR